MEILDYSILRLAEIMGDGTTSHDHTLGWYQTLAMWKQLKEEVLRLSDQIRKEKNRKPRLEILTEELKNKRQVQSKDKQEGRTSGH